MKMEADTVCLLRDHTVLPRPPHDKDMNDRPQMMPKPRSQGRLILVVWGATGGLTSAKRISLIQPMQP